MAAASCLTMSSILVLVLFSLCCLQACGARRLLSVDTQHNIDDRSLRSRSLHHYSREGVEEVGKATLLPEAAPSVVGADEPRSARSLVKRDAAGREGAMEEAKHGGAVGTAEDLEEVSEEGSGDGARWGAAAPAGDQVRTQSMVTVSWQVPRDPHRGHPGFNIDYDAPRTHPPSHN